MINDVTALRDDSLLARAVADGGAALVLMHSRGSPATMGDRAVYEDLIAEVIAELRASIAHAMDAGVPSGSIIVDPGIGFAKRPSHSYGVLARLPELASALDRPWLVGPGTAAAVTAAVLAGAHIVRVHAVEEMVQVVRVAEEIRNAAGQRA